MLTIENVDVYGWEAAIRGMRNPKNSWDKSDTNWQKYYSTDDHLQHSFIGENDLRLMKQLASAGNDHGKFLRMINVTMDITAPLYWWKEYDTYKIGTVADSCSTMHKIHAKEFTLDDFSHEHLGYDGMKHLEDTVSLLNFYRDKFNEGEDWNGMCKKDFWWEMIQSLPTSYNQKRTVQVNYQVLKAMYHARKAHKLDEWREFCTVVELSVPYFKELCVDGD